MVLCPCFGLLQFFINFRTVEYDFFVEFQVIELGGTPTIGDCAIILRAAMKAPVPSAFITILQTTHSLGHKFGR
jgi:hypothetical protein